MAEMDSDQVPWDMISRRQPMPSFGVPSWHSGLRAVLSPRRLQELCEDLPTDEFRRQLYREAVVVPVLLNRKGGVLDEERVRAHVTRDRHNLRPVDTISQVLSYIDLEGEEKPKKRVTGKVTDALPADSKSPPGSRYGQGRAEQGKVGQAAAARPAAGLRSGADLERTVSRRIHKAAAAASSAALPLAPAEWAAIAPFAVIHEFGSTPSSATAGPGAQATTLRAAAAWPAVGWARPATCPIHERKTATTPSQDAGPKGAGTPDKCGSSCPSVKEWQPADVLALGLPEPALANVPEITGTISLLHQVLRRGSSHGQRQRRTRLPVGVGLAASTHRAESQGASVPEQQRSCTSCLRDSCSRCPACRKMG